MVVATKIFRMPNGVEIDWDVLVVPDVVATVALTELGEVVLVRQYRPGPDRVLNEIPGGHVDRDETPLEAAKRELQEETGYVGECAIIGHTWQGGTITRRKWVAVATACRKVSEPSLDPSEEFCETLLLSLQEFRHHLQAGQLTDAWAGYAALDHLNLL